MKEQTWKDVTESKEFKAQQIEDLENARKFFPGFNWEYRGDMLSGTKGSYQICVHYFLKSVEEGPRFHGSVSCGTHSNVLKTIGYQNRTMVLEEIRNTLIKFIPMLVEAMRPIIAAFNTLTKRIKEDKALFELVKLELYKMEGLEDETD